MRPTSATVFEMLVINIELSDEKCTMLATAVRISLFDSTRAINIMLSMSLLNVLDSVTLFCNRFYEWRISHCVSDSPQSIEAMGCMNE
jgi:hypothetical protein